MSDERTKKEVAPSESDRRGAGARLKTERDQRQAVERKPSPIEREWRGSGVCGDRHTD
ncbi:MAG TPA: hypothetical protein VLX85_14320 [Stellaceae bacterium]|nr:hypothetical protein [Stellaceae bacterium]